MNNRSDDLLYRSGLTKAKHRSQLRSVNDSQKNYNVKPKPSEMSEGVSTYKVTREGLKEYIKINNIVYESAFTRSNSQSNSNILYPDYDSGWVDITVNMDYPFIHKLSTKMLRLEVYLKSDAGNIWNIGATSLHGIFDATNKDTGVEIFMHTDNQITVKTAAYNIFSTHNGTEVDDGYLRILAWKIGIQE